VTLTPEDIAKLQTKQLANIIRKLNAGKSITAREEAILAQARAAGEAEATPAAAPITSGYVKTWDELADACGVDRRTLTNIRQKAAKLIKQRGKLLTRADGRHCIAEWMKLLAELGVKGRGVNNPDIDVLDERTLRLEERKLRVERERYELECAKIQVVSVAQVGAALGQALATFNQSLDALAGRVAAGIDEADRDELLKLLTRAEKQKITFKKLRNLVSRGEFIFADFHARRQFIASEIKAVKLTLARCEYLEVDADAE